MDNDPQNISQTQSNVSESPAFVPPVPEYQPPSPIEPVSAPKKINKILTFTLIALGIFIFLIVILFYAIINYSVFNLRKATTASIVKSEVRLAEYKSASKENGVNSSYGTTDSMPNNYLPTAEDKQAAEKAIRDYFELLNEKNFIEAVDSMSYDTIKSESVRQSLILGFSNWASVEIVSIEEIDEQTWFNSTPQYHVVFNTVFDPTKNDNFEYGNGGNSRYVFVINEEGIMKVHSLKDTTDTIF